ncbi:LOW QUALITY PROTEIN: hypothetical protein U9M48_011465 [Paspalum notatum var. saurae]|uniref:Uncharacterized protein n=1 Tax=Paspalum notatum var. saurae TaxID=547442 RepID=A0AAQ3WHE0_PASNO
MDELMDDLVEGILLRCPPADPASLVRAALTLAPPHLRPGLPPQIRRAPPDPPTLGFFHRMPNCTRFLPAAASSFRPPYADAVPADWRAMHALHCRVLYSGGGDLVVSCPMTGDHRRLPMPRPPHTSEKYYNWSAAVLCAAAPCGCDHLDCCPRGPFAVVAVVTNEPQLSLTSAWRVAACVEHPEGSVFPVSPLLAAGNALYFEFVLGTRNSSVKILEFDLGKQELSFIDLPRKVSPRPVLLAENGGRLEIAAVVGSKVHIWLRDDTAAASRRRLGWAWNRVIDLTRLFPAVCTASAASPRFLAFVDGFDVLLVSIPFVGVFNLHIKSGLVTKMIKLCFVQIVVDITYI